MKEDKNLDDNIKETDLKREYGRVSKEILQIIQEKNIENNEEDLEYER